MQMTHNRHREKQAVELALEEERLNPTKKKPRHGKKQVGAVTKSWRVEKRNWKRWYSLKGVGIFCIVELT